MSRCKLSSTLPQNENYSDFNIFEYQHLIEII